jgi:hypothetical protein
MSLAVVELEPASRGSPEREPPRPALLLLLEELREGVLSVGEGVPALLGHGVHRVLAVVEALPQLRVGEHLVRLVEQCHLRLGAALVRVCDLRGFAAANMGGGVRGRVEAVREFRG